MPNITWYQLDDGMVGLSNEDAIRLYNYLVDVQAYVAITQR